MLTSHLLQSVGSVLDLLRRLPQHLCQFGHSIAQLLTQQRVVLPKLLHRYS